MILGLDRVILHVADVPAAARQYAALIGIAPVGSAGAVQGKCAHGSVEFRLRNVRLVLAQAADAEVDGAGGAGMQADARAAGREGPMAGRPAVLVFSLKDAERAITTLRRRALRVDPMAEDEPRCVVSHAVHADQALWPGTVWRIPAQATHGVEIWLVPAETLAAGAGDGGFAPVARWPETQRVGPATSTEPDSPGVALTGLDHVVIRTADPERALATYGARLGLDLRRDMSRPEWSTRFLFFRCGDLILEVTSALPAPVVAGPHPPDDRLWGLAWRTDDIDSTHERLRKAGFAVSAARPGRAPGTRVFSVTSGTCDVPTLILDKIPGTGRTGQS